MKLPVTLLILAACANVHAEENTLALGGGLGAGPRYAGSREMQASPIVIIDYQMANGLYASTTRGLGYGAALGDFSLDASLGLRGGRREKNDSGVTGNSGSSDLRGMGDIKSSATANFRAGYSPAPGLELSAKVSLPLSHKENGRTAGLELSRVVLQNKTDKLALSLGANFGDAKHLQTYHGVSAAQAQRTGRAQFAPHAGMYALDLGMSWDHQIDPDWSVSTMLGASKLVRYAARSPLTLRTTSPKAAVFATYRY